MPAIVPIALGASALFRGIFGASQASKARKGLANLERPEYEIPDSAKQALAYARLSMGEMPGATERREAIGSSASNAVQLARESGNPLLAIAGIQQNQDQASRELSVDQANYNVAQNQKLQEALGRYGQYQDLKWQMNEYAPYKQKYDEYRHMLGAGQQNMFSAVDGLGSGLLSAALGGIL